MDYRVVASGWLGVVAVSRSELPMILLIGFTFYYLGKTLYLYWLRREFATNRQWVVNREPW